MGVILGFGIRSDTCDIQSGLYPDNSEYRMTKQNKVKWDFNLKKYVQYLQHKCAQGNLNENIFHVRLNSHGWMNRARINPSMGVTKFSFYPATRARPDQQNIRQCLGYLVGLGQANKISSIVMPQSGIVVPVIFHWSELVATGCLPKNDGDFLLQDSLQKML